MSSSSRASTDRAHCQTIAHSSIEVSVPRLSKHHTRSSAPRPDGECKRRRQVADIPWSDHSRPSVPAQNQMQQQAESTSPTTTQRYYDHHHQAELSNPDDQLASAITIANQKRSERHLRQSTARQQILCILKLIAIEDADEVRRESARVLVQMMSANPNPTNSCGEVSCSDICE